MWKIIFAIISVATMFIGVDCSGKSMKLSQAWTRATPAGATTADIYLTLQNRMGTPDTLTTINSYVAESATIITTQNVNGIVQPQSVSALKIDTDKEIVMSPGRMYIQLQKLKQPLKVGDTFPLTITFEKGGDVLEDVIVEAPDALSYSK